jgi:hypothetical protein
MYLAGAGVGVLEVERVVVAECSGINSEVHLVVLDPTRIDAGADPFRAGLVLGNQIVWCPVDAHLDDGVTRGQAPNSLRRGAAAALWVILRILSSDRCEASL